MKVLLQRVSRASVKVESEVVGEIGVGLLAFVGVARGDTAVDAKWMAKKLLKLRVFEDDDGKMNRSVVDVSGEVLLVSQFTLCADIRKGTRPSFGGAMAPEEAKAFFEDFKALLATEIDVATGTFQAHMDVELNNDGPVTLMLESPTKKNQP
ncbi:MAG: D-tyrosyl-tRNA(Tyr) deacylase [Deltaproteobacteria bacterium]|nr:D-tyrosyl-tRNA(Tyr) deacylase [Deltaproteobacteria bacterium]